MINLLVIKIRTIGILCFVSRMNMGNPSKTIFYDQDEYYDDEDDDLYD